LLRKYLYYDYTEFFIGGNIRDVDSQLPQLLVEAINPEEGCIKGN
jgi:hypothetical protein